MAVLLAALLTLLPTSSAAAFIYWPPRYGDEAIARANNDGSAVDWTFVLGVGAAGPVTVDAHHIYWLREGTPLGHDAFGNDDAIGRAGLNGAHVDRDFVHGAGEPTGIAVEGDHIYWTNTYPEHSIGRANLDGSHPDINFIDLAETPFGLAADSSHLYISFLDAYPATTSGHIARVDLDGQNFEPQFIATSGFAQGLAVDGSHIYWANDADVEHLGPGSVGRASIDGSTVDQTFIVGAHDPFSIAVSSSEVVWANAFPATFGHAGLDGTDPVIDMPSPDSAGPVAIDDREDRGVDAKVAADPTQRQSPHRPVRVEVRIKAREKLTAHVRGTVHGSRIWHLERQTSVLLPGATRTLRLAADSAHSQSEISAALRRGKELRARITVRLNDALGHSKRWRRIVRF